MITTTTRRLLAAGIAVLTASTLLTAGAGAAVAAPAARGQSHPLITSRSVLADLDRIAATHAGTRSMGSPGGIASGDYIITTLTRLGLSPRVQQFPSRDGTVQGRNIIVDVTRGSSDRVVMFGAHYDSVAAGPGIVDNGSGTANLLQLAATNARRAGQSATLRLTFWDGEESSLLGSSAYAKQMSPTEIASVSAYVNVDMTATRDGIVSVLDADRSSLATLPPDLQSMFDAYQFSAQERQLEKLVRASYPNTTELSEGLETVTNSDAGPFHSLGIPVTGIGMLSKHEQVTADGELLFAPCYHQACDTAANADLTALDDNEAALRRLADTLTR